MRRFPPAVALFAVVATASPGSAQPIAARWRSPSRLTPSEASSVLYRRAEGQAVRAEDLLEAEKHFRTDGPVSPAEYVLTDVLRRRLAARVRDEPVRLRVLPPVLHWLESTETVRGIRVRGETVQVAVLSSPPGRATTVLRHETIHQEWTTCGADVCVAAIATPVRRQVGYSMWGPRTAAEVASTIPSLRLFDTLRCDPEPVEIADPGRDSRFGIVLRHIGAETAAGAAREISCAFAALPPRARARLSYTDAGHLAVPPSRAARGAVVNNPLEFSLDE